MRLASLVKYLSGTVVALLFTMPLLADEPDDPYAPQPMSIDGDSLVWRKGADGGTGLIEEIILFVGNDALLGQWRSCGARRSNFQAASTRRRSQRELFRHRPGRPSFAPLNGRGAGLTRSRWER